MLSQTHCKELKQQRTSGFPVFHIEDTANGDQNFEDIAELIKQLNGKPNHQMDKELPNIPDSPSYAFNGDNQISLTSLDIEETKKPQSLQIPEDFRCPISLELMKDPVIVSTGQVMKKIKL